MRSQSRAFRLSAATALAAMLTGAVAPAYAQAPGPAISADQGAGLPAVPQAGANGAPAGDPPGRVGVVASITGTVSFHAADAAQWEPATLNFPVTSGNAFWTEPAASADLDISAIRITLDETTQFTIDTLDDQTLAATAGQGRVFVAIHAIAEGETDSIRTPRGVVTFTQPGAYEVVVGDTNTPTQVVVDSGAASISGPGLATQVGPHQTADITGTDSFTATLVAEAPDGFLTAQITRERPVVANGTAAPPPVVMEMTGYQAVENTGQWSAAPEYGSVWYPPVDPGWVPYRQGHWSFVAPWGWTWIDNAPWGFAPFHYGRWVQIGPRWAWTPVVPGVVIVGRPYYAPALVTFVGLAAGVAIGVGIGASVGWIPLGPREIYRPPYPVSQRYVRQVNVYNVTNYNAPAGNHYINARAATQVPASAMQRSQPIAAAARPFTPAQQASLRPLARAPVQPTQETRGVTPAVANAMHLPPARAAAPHPASPGPAFQSRPAGAAAVSRPMPNAPQPAARPMSVAPAPRPVAPQVSPAPRPAAVAPVARPATPQAFRPNPAGAPAARPAPTPAAAPRPNVNPAPAPVARPVPALAPVARPAPAPMARPSPPPAPMPRPAPAPAPMARPAPPQPAARPAPPPQAHPAPAPHKECPQGRPNC
jgi:hypothetical protein